jgi:peptidyl-dipeptidase A
VSSEFLSFVDETAEELRPLEVAYNRASWDAATQGTAASNQREKETQARLLRFWADPDRFQTAKRLYEANHPDPLVSRQIKLLYLASARAQQTEAEIQSLTELEADVRSTYYSFRAEIDGAKVSDNDLDRILKTSRDSAEVQRAWEASKQVAVPAADAIRALARLRNQSARAHGFRDHFVRSLTLDEIDEGFLLDLFDRLDRMTAALFQRYKARLDATRAKRFGISVSDLMPWHYGDPFFQEAPEMDSVGLEEAFEGQDPVKLALASYDALDMDVKDILDRSDLYARPGKNQHAFCIDIDREGDIRTLNNLEPTQRWIKTLHHELGHGVYEKFLDPNLPWLLRQPSHTLSTEAIAIMMESQTSDPRWMTDILGLSEAEAGRLAAAAQERAVARQLVFTRWVLVMTNFERQMYADPERDLDGLWWDLIEKHQLLQRPPGRQAPDWAAKYHIALVPVYYQNYELGYLFKSQVMAHLTQSFGGLVGRPEAGRWLVERIFAPGARRDWARHLETATGEPLDPGYFAAGLK